MQTKSPLIKILSATLVVVACGFIYYLLAEDWAGFVQSVAEVDVVLFSVSVFLGLAANLVAAYFYVFLVKGHHEVRHGRSLFKIFLLSQLVRYVPGKVWSYVYQISLAPAEVSKTATVLSNFEMMAINMVVIGGAASALLVWPGYLSIVIFVGGLSLAVSFGYRLGLVDWVLGRLFRLMARFGVVEMEPRSYNVAGMTLLVAVWVLLVIVAMIVAMHAIWPLSTSDSIVYAACLLLSWILSALVVIVPVGIGVRETGFVALSVIALSTLDGGQLAATAIIIRFWQLLVDALSGVSGLLLPRE